MDGTPSGNAAFVIHMRSDVSGVRCVIEGRGGKLFHSWIIFKSLLNVHLFILVAVRSLVCQMCLVKSLIMFFVVILVSVCVKKGILEMFII